MADSATDSRLGLEVDTGLKCPRCGSTVRAGAKRCPRGHVLSREKAMARRIVMAAQVSEARLMLPRARHGSGRYEGRLHPRDRSGKWRRTFTVRTPRGKVAGVVEQHSESGEFRAVVHTADKGLVPGVFHTEEQAKNAILTVHYEHAFDAPRFDRKTVTVAHDVSYAEGMGGTAREPGGGMKFTRTAPGTYEAGEFTIRASKRPNSVEGRKVFGQVPVNTMVRDGWEVYRNGRLLLSRPTLAKAKSAAEMRLRMEPTSDAREKPAKVTRSSLSVGDTVLATPPYSDGSNYRGFRGQQRTKMEAVKVSAINGPDVTFEDGTMTTMNGGARIAKLPAASDAREKPAKPKRPQDLVAGDRVRRFAPGSPEGTVVSVSPGRSTGVGRRRVNGIGGQVVATWDDSGETYGLPFEQVAPVAPTSDARTKPLLPQAPMPSDQPKPDTPAQARILRTSRSAQRARELYPEGTRVTARGKDNTPGPVGGTVVRHIPMTNAQGGSLIVKWDNGIVGRANPGGVMQEPSDARVKPALTAGPSLADRRAQATAAAAALDAKAREHAIPEPTGPTPPGSLAGKDLTQVHPKAIDSELGRLWVEQARYKGYLGKMDDQDAKDRARGTRGFSGMPPAMAERHAVERAQERRRYEAKLAELRAEAAPLENEFQRRGGWARYYLVTNGNGHVHKTMNCSTCLRTTQFAWLPDLAAKTETTMVEHYGEKACSVCFPSAPSMYEAMKKDGKISTAATLIQAEKDARAALKAERDAKKNAKAIAMPDGSPLRGKWGQINTLVTAQRELVDVAITIGGSERALAAGNETGHTQRLAEYRTIFENIIAAISHKTNVEPAQVRATALEKAAKKAEKQGGWW